MDLSAFLSPLFGGALIGLSATYYLLAHGRVAGISGIIGTAVSPSTSREERRQPLHFLTGLILAGVFLYPFLGEHFEASPKKSLLRLAVAGLLVGFGTRLGSGCTSGHGVCGISRFSLRSVVATVTFCVAGALVVSVTRLFGGVL